MVMNRVELVYISSFVDRKSKKKKMREKEVTAPSENRTRVFSATTRCPNHWTMEAERHTSLLNRNLVMHYSHNHTHFIFPFEYYSFSR